MFYHEAILTILLLHINIMILGRDLDPGLRTFGWQIYGEDDVDHNEYPGTLNKIVSQNDYVCF